MFNIYDALYAQSQNKGQVVAEDRNGTWYRVAEALQTEQRGLFVRKWQDNTWFTPQQWKFIKAADIAA